MMGYVVDIKNKLSSMKNKDLHEEFEAITDRLIATDQLDLLSSVYHIIERYDKMSRENMGLRKTNDNLNKKLYARSNEYMGGNYGRGEKQL